MKTKKKKVKKFKKGGLLNNNLKIYITIKRFVFM